LKLSTNSPPGLRDEYVDVRNPALARDLNTAADVASQQARWRSALMGIAASLPAGSFARNEILALVSKQDSALPTPPQMTPDQGQGPIKFLVGPFLLPNQSTAASSACRLSGDRDLSRPDCSAC